MYNHIGDIMLTEKEKQLIQLNKFIETATRFTVEQAAQQERERFAERLRTLRNDAGLTQRQLADKSNLHQTLIARYESAKSMPRQNAIEKLAAALDVVPAALDVSGNADSLPITDIKLLRKHGINARKVQDGMYALSAPGCPEIPMTINDMDSLWEYCADKTNKDFTEVLESYFVNLFIREAYAECENRNAPDQNGSDTPAE